MKGKQATRGDIKLTRIIFSKEKIWQNRDRQKSSKLAGRPRGPGSRRDPSFVVGVMDQPSFTETCACLLVCCSLKWSEEKHAERSIVESFFSFFFFSLSSLSTLRVLDRREIQPRIIDASSLLISCPNNDSRAAFIASCLGANTSFRFAGNFVG